MRRLPGRLILAALALSCVAAPAAAMSVAQFLQKAYAIRASGIFAMNSPDIQVLKAELIQVSNAYRASPYSRAPHSCPPPPSQVRITAQQFLADLESIPAGQRGMSMQTAFVIIMKRHYPCRR